MSQYYMGYAYTKNLFIAYLKFKFNWASYNYLANLSVCQKFKVEKTP